jgi:hypothetical protein
MAREVAEVGHGLDISKNFIRGAARLLVADMTVPFPTELDDAIRMATTSDDEEQTVTITGTPAGGTFTLTFRGYTTAAIAHNAASADVVTALEALSSIGTGGVTATGGALPGTAVVITFAAQLGGQSVPLITATSSLTGGTTPAIAVTRTNAGFGQFDAQTGWTDLGVTKGGITVNRNNAEEAFDVDQIYADILTLPTSWEMNVSASCARADIDLLQYLWEGGTITVNSSPSTGPERTLPLGTPSSYRHRRLCVYFQRPSLDGGVTAGYVRAYCFRDTIRTAQESGLAHNKTGDQATVPFTWRAVPDQNVVDRNARFGAIIDQAPA